MVIDTLIDVLNKAGIVINAFASDKAPCINYEFVSLTSDKIKRQDRFTLTVIDRDYIKALEQAEHIKSILLTFGDNKLQDNVFSVELTGGGTLHNNKMFHVKQIYTIKSKEKRY